eukprot:TRINITY_DN6456_c0_g1_i10.p1 TRINITY_DN6456_c0_g1~~TRINITY_DN6456_c0_g1_i10.p1  ORF type:complete len:291 (-),score=3.98 TRINITY_DN6456_c0_g1_i10:108-980(-)
MCIRDRYMGIIMNIEEPTQLERFVSLIYCCLFFAAEIFCVYANFRCIAIVYFRSQACIIVSFISMHLILGFSLFIHSNNVKNYSGPGYNKFFDYLVILPKDILILAFTRQVLQFMGILDNKSKLLKIKKIILWVALGAHTICFISLFAYEYDEITNLYGNFGIFLLYLIFAIISIGFICICSLTKAIKCWTTNYNEMARKYLDWLLKAVIFMTLVLALRITISIGIFLGIQQGIRELTVEGYVVYMAIAHIGCNLLPCVFVCECLCRMADRMCDSGELAFPDNISNSTIN